MKKILLLLTIFLCLEIISADDDKQCEPNSNFMIECNRCRCSSDGTRFWCTRMACVDFNRPKRQAEDPKPEEPKQEDHAEATPENGQVCTPGDVKHEDCNRIERTLYNNFMATIPVYNPLSPFLGLIPGGFRVGQMIRIKGVLNYYGHRFQINIQTGPALRPRDDVGLHLSVRPQEHAIARNTMTNSTWGSEERHGGCPLNPGQNFDIFILAEHSCYKIAINGVHFCAFNHRMSLSRMQFVSIDGEVTIHSITQEGDTSGHTGHVPPMPVPANSVPVYPPTPYGAAGGAYPGSNPYGSHYGTAPPAPPPPPYSPYPGGPGGHGVYGQPGVIYQPNQPMNSGVAGSAYGAYPQFQKKKSNKALKYAAGAAGVGAGIGLTALAISSLTGGGGDCDDCGDAGDVDVDF